MKDRSEQLIAEAKAMKYSRRTVMKRASAMGLSAAALGGVLRNDGVEAAVLETARGGILRRGLAVTRTDVAVVTNVSADHFGEYGIHDLDSLADVKLTVGAVVRPGGSLVLNADDARLRGKAVGLERRLAMAPPLLAVLAENRQLVSE